MIPKTENEVELYFRLTELNFLYKRQFDGFPYMQDQFRKLASDEYKKKLSEYLNLANQ